MSSDQIANIIEGSIPLAAGIYFTLLGHRIVGKKPGIDYKYDDWIEGKTSLFKTLGPIVIIFGVIQIGRAFI